MILSASKHGWIGVDAGASTIKLAQIARQSGRLRLENAAVIPRLHANSGPDAQPAGSALHEIESALAVIGGGAGRRAAGVLSMAACDVVPGKQAVAAGVAAEETNRCVANWQADPDAGNEGWYTFSADEMTADSLCKDMLDAGLSCRTIDSMPHALSRAVALAQGDARGKVVSVVDWGDSGAMFCAVRDGRPVYVRRIRQCGLAEFEAEIREELGLSRAAVHELLLNASAEGDETIGELVLEIIRPAAANLAEELRRTISHLKSHRRNLEPEKVWLMGGGAMTGAEKLLADRLDWPVEAWNPTTIETPSGTPLGLLGPAIALSMLAWEDR